ncbi:uncharacterized protein LOC126983987 [Eriocheir sinensis]|uniref:uncharacterized protein LOC126983987 n=1 Tax=Eriocheir sinensis TaxID=95602 RepID=UPI0021C5DC77|nr:uncharacterized protein LOC126983987 [Eriocheir sinensis]
MGLRWVRVALVVALAAVGPGWGREGPSLSSSPLSSSSLSSSSSAAYNPAEECKHMRFSRPDQESVTRESVLRQMCLRAAPHVDVTETFKQFAIFLLQRDDFDGSPKWHSGNAKDVLSDPYWSVNEVTVLQATRYYWYVHGLPMWPLPYQALTNRTSRRLFKKKPVDWPSYGLATPIYYASNAWRDQTWSLEEFFQQTKKKTPFKNHDDFHKLAKEVVAAVNGSQVESYGEWPFLKYSLPPMVRSMVQRNKGICPDDLYIYLRLTPCNPADPAQAVCAQAARHARLLLTVASCPNTAVIVGYSKEYSEADNVRPL